MHCGIDTSFNTFKFIVINWYSANPTYLQFAFWLLEELYLLSGVGVTATENMDYHLYCLGGWLIIKGSTE